MKDERRFFSLDRFVPICMIMRAVLGIKGFTLLLRILFFFSQFSDKVAT